MIKADVELGATEQKFNLVIGRQIQKEYGQEPQVILTLPVLEGLDGKQRMSKSIGNYIGIDESPKEIYGKTMSIPDNMIYRYYELITDVDAAELRKIKADLDGGQVNPRDIKKDLGKTIVRMYHGEAAAAAAEKEFENIFAKKDLPDEIPEAVINDEVMRIDDLIVFTKTADSKGQARRLVKGGAVSINGEKINDPFQEIKIENGQVLKVGKRKFVRLALK
jgi:tyrosyl-tRNA synthetase